MRYHEIMKMRYLLLHAFVLGMLNFTGSTIAFFLWKLLDGPQRIVQGWLAAAIVFFGFWLWLRFAASRGIDLARRKREFVTIWILASFIPAGVFIPLHYFTQGYLTSMGNIWALLRLALPTNFAALGLMLLKSGA